MARCSHPHYTIDLGIKENGKRNLKFIGFNPDLSSLKQLQARYGKSAIVPLPCGSCIQCRINKAKEWAVRCVLESLCHDENWFITLTYDKEHLPVDGKLHREHIQDFFKRLRYYIGPFRYFGCGEYGSKTKRPHFHLILFGAKISPFNRLNSFRQVKNDVLSKVWPFGQYDIGEVNYSSCNYVAQYSCKKVFGLEQTDEFIMASTAPGLGAEWCEKNINKIWKYDAVYGYFGNSKEARLPRYFDKLAERIDSSLFDELKKKRLSAENSIELNELLVHEFTEVEYLLEYKEKITLNQFLSKKRGVRLDL